MQLNGSATSLLTATCEWDVRPIIASKNRVLHNYAVLILNRPLSQSQEFLKNLWNGGKVSFTLTCFGFVHFEIL